MNKLSLALATLALAVSARAATESAALQARGFESTAAEAILPFVPADVFAGVGACGVLDIKTIRAWTLDEAAEMAAPCFAAVGAKYRVKMDLEPGFLAAAQEGRPAKTGLILKTDVVPGSMAHRDLVTSLTRRGGMLLGHPVRLLARGEAAPASVSAVQEALAKCILVDVVRDVKDGSDFVRIYGRCLQRDSDLKIDELRPGKGLSVTMKTEAASDRVEALNGFVTVNAGKGPVQVMVVAYSAQLALP